MNGRIPAHAGASIMKRRRSPHGSAAAAGPAIALAGLLIAGCAGPPDRAPVTSGPEVEAVTAWLDRYLAAINAGDVEGWLAFVADDAVIMPPDEPPITGITEIRPRYQEVYARWAFDFTARPDDIVVAGDLAIVRAFYDETVTPRAAGDPLQFKGSWLLVLRRQPAGAWKLWRNMWGVIPTSE